VHAAVVPYILKFDWLRCADSSPRSWSAGNSGRLIEYCKVLYAQLVKCRMGFEGRDDRAIEVGDDGRLIIEQVDASAARLEFVENPDLPAQPGDIGDFHCHRVKFARKVGAAPISPEVQLLFFRLAFA
jgi:hypothetical protein